MFWEPDASWKRAPRSRSGRRPWQAGKRAPFTAPLDPELPHALIDPPVLDGASGVIMLADPYSFPADVALAEFARQAPGVPVLGGLASARTLEGGGALFFGAELREFGAVGVSLHGVELLPCVSQGAAPLGPGMTVTAAEGNVIHELEGMPAIQAVEEVAGALEPRERALLAGGLLVGIAIEEPGPDNEVGSGALEQGDFLVRGVVGADPETGSLAVGASVEPGSVVRLHARDPGSADQDLRDALRLRMAAIAGGRPAGALVFSCNGRGRGMFGAPDHDAQDGRARARRSSGSGVLRRRRDRSGRGTQLPARLHRNDRGVRGRGGGCGGAPASSKYTGVTMGVLDGEILLTGATGGIGHAIARALSGRGGRLILSGRRADVLEPLAAEVGGRAVACDLSQRADVERLGRRSAASVDLFVANAALPASGALTELTQEQIDKMIEVNLRAPIALARSLAERMSERRRGHMVFVSSLAGKVASPASSIYSATKFGLRGFALGLREDLRPHGVGVSVVLPGFIHGAGMFADAGIDLPRGVGTRSPEDVAAAVIRAVERNRAELEVAPAGLRIGASIGGLAPGLASAVSRRMGSDKVATDLAAGQVDKRDVGSLGRSVSAERVLAGDAGHRGDDLVGEPGAVDGALGRGLDANHDLLPIDLLEQHGGCRPGRRLDLLVEQRLHLARPNPRRQPHSNVDGVRLTQRHYRGRQHDVVWDQDPVLPARERRVEQAERADDAFCRAAHRAGLKPYALANSERPSTQQHHAGDQVAERLLRRKTEDHRGEGAADREVLRLHAGDSQRDQQRDENRREPDQEPDGSGGARIHSPEEGRRGGPADVAREGPPERHQGDHSRDSHRRDPRAARPHAQQLPAVEVENQHPSERRDKHDRFALRPADRPLAHVHGQPDPLPRLAAGLEHPLQM